MHRVVSSAFKGFAPASNRSSFDLGHWEKKPQFLQSHVMKHHNTCSNHFSSWVGISTMKVVVANEQSNILLHVHEKGGIADPLHELMIFQNQHVLRLPTSIGVRRAVHALSQPSHSIWCPFLICKESIFVSSAVTKSAGWRERSWKKARQIVHDPFARGLLQGLVGAKRLRDKLAVPKFITGIAIFSLRPLRRIHQKRVHSPLHVCSFALLCWASQISFHHLTFSNVL